jgi:hypothetical protein
MNLGKVELIERGQEVQLRTTVETEGRRRHLWYAVERRYGDYLTPESLDPFVVGLLVPAMMAREDIHLEGPLSEKLYWNLTHYYMRILRVTNPAFRSVRIFPAELTRDPLSPPPTGVATGFSGGIDSFCVLADHFFADVPSGYRITHLIYNNVGVHRQAGYKLFMERYQRLAPCAEDMGLPFISINSNLDDFYQVDFGQTHTARNVSAALALQKLFGKYLYAGGFRYEDCVVAPSKSPAYTDPFTVHLLSTENTACISDGCQYSRVEKTSKVAELAPSYHYLDVCFDRTNTYGAGNCSVCQKCVRTLLTLEILGKAHLYEQAFDLEKYRSIRRHFLGKVVASRDPMMREIRQLARARGFTFPPDVHIVGVSRGICKRVREWRTWYRTRR